MIYTGGGPSCSDYIDLSDPYRGPVYHNWMLILMTDERKSNTGGISVRNHRDVYFFRSSFLDCEIMQKSPLCLGKWVHTSSEKSRVSIALLYFNSSGWLYRNPDVSMLDI